MNVQTESHTRLHGKWLLIARLTWAVVFTVLTIMYALGFLAARDALSTVCKEELCTFRQQIRHTDIGEQVVSWSGPPIGYADRLRPDQVEALERFGLTLDQYGWLGALEIGLPVLVYLLIAAGLFWRRSDDWMVLFASVMVATIPVGNGPLPFMLVVHRPAWEWVFDSVGVVALSCFLIFPLLFPNGRFVPRWTRWMALYEVTGAAIIILFQNSVLERPGAEKFILIYLLISFGTGIYAQLYRYFQVASSVERQQLKWVIVGLAGFVSIALIMLLPLDALLTSRAAGMDPARALLLSVIPDTVFQLILLFIPVSIAISVLRYRLWDIDFIISRTLIYGALTASIVGLYILIVGGLGTLFQTQNNLASIVIAILLIAFLFQPLLQRLQDIVNHLVPVPEAATRPELQIRPEQKVASTDVTFNTTLQGDWLVFTRLAWAAGFMVLTAMYALGFLAVKEALSTVCEDESCSLRQQIRHTDAGDQVISSPGPTFGYADRLRPNQVEALDRLGLTLDQYGWLGGLQLGIPALILLLIGAGLFWWKSNDWMVLFASVMVATFPIHNSPLAFTLMVYQPAWERVYDLAGVVAISSLLIFPLIFPDGKFVPRWTRWMACYEVICAVFVMAVQNNIRQMPGGLVFLGAAFLFPSLGIGVYAQLYRYFRVARLAERQQFKWVVFGLLGFIVIQFFVLIPLNALLTSRAVSADPVQALILSAIPDTLWQVNLLLLPLCITISILRYRLWDIDIIINRTLVYGILSAGIVVTYILLVGLLGTLFNTNVSLAATLVTAALTIPFFQTLRARVQSIVNRITFGGRDVPSFKQEIEETPTELEMPLRKPWPAWLLFALTCVLSAISIVFLALSWTTLIPDTWGFRGDAILFALSFSSIGLLLAWRQPQNSIGWLLLIAGLLCAILEFCIDYATYALLTKSGTLPGGTLAAWVSSWVWVMAISMLIYTFLLFPTGHLPSARWRPIAWFVVGAFALPTLTFMIQPGPLYFAPYLDNPFAVQPVYRVLRPLEVTSAVAILLIGFSVILRLQRAEGVERQQLKWFAYTALLITLIGITDSLAGAAGLIGRDSKFYQYITVVIWIAIPFAIAFTILRYRLWDIDLIINRTLVYGALTAGIVALYILLVGALSLLSQTMGNLLISLLATGLIAFLFQPLRERLQRGVNRLLYGDRDDPYAALSRLGRRLEASLAPEAVLPTVVTTVREALKLPYTAIYLKQQEADYKIIAESASPSLRVENGKIRVPGMEREGHCIPLIHQGETLGYLVLGPRTPNEAFTSSDLRLVDDLAPQVGVAVHAMRLTSDLQRSREQLVLTREEERRRLRRDLHDSLGPNLASQGLKLAAVKQLLEHNPAAAIPLLDQVMDQNKSTVADVRRLVYGLRPPALDELGLVAAIRDHVAGMDGKSTLQIEIAEPPDGLPTLSAAVEVAAYRIVLEALTNTIRHAQAKHCVIRFSVSHNGSSDILGIEIQDDGKGMPRDHRTGVGLRSMRERAEEIGGVCVIESNLTQGTCVSVKVPLITM